MCSDVEACQFANNRDEYFKGVSHVLEEMAGDVLEESARDVRYHFTLGSMSGDIGQALRKLSGEILVQAK